MERTFDLARELLALEEASPVAPHRSPEELIASLDLSIGRDGVSDEAIFAEMAKVLAFTPRTSTRRFCNQLFSGRDEVATGAEILSTLLNISMYTFKAAGPHVIMEKQLTRRMAQLAGFAEGEGVFAPGGSVSNFYAMVMARNEAEPTLHDMGYSDRPLTMYTSEVSHYSIVKNAGLLGIGRRRVRLVAADEQGRMRPDALRRAIVKDMHAGRVPFLINATSGTTVQGAFDPLDAIADVAEEFGIWLHVDGAMGASVLYSEKHRGLMHGVSRANSLTWDTHKIMGIPLLCSVILTREPGMLLRHFTQDATYLFQTDREYSHGNMSLQCGRRNDAFKLWAMWKKLGDVGMAERIETVLANAKRAAQMVRERPGLTLCKAPESVNVCFEVNGRSSEAICDVLRASEQFIVGYAVVDGRRIIRLACVNFDLTEDDLREFFDAVELAASHLPEVDNACGLETDMTGAEYADHIDEASTLVAAALGDAGA